jgi:site-specific DNA recombinase
MAEARLVRCAIYTRKSSEEGLEQSFNSLDAQREACEAYIASQRHEGWQCLPARYDDGGYSGGNLKRPALEALMNDLRGGKVDLIVVYKIDRLTRSLMDFSSLVTVFDTHKASFVSVTQHFNTTTSMGRLTLNVLLSFAQFEREVTGERIRDKIAASKRKGMWMGGRVPLGYLVVDRQLRIHDEDAAFLRHLFARYLALKSVALLQEELKEQNQRVFSRGALYLLLQNRLYRGEIQHREAIYPGQHEAIIAPELWDAVQAQLSENRDERKARAKNEETSLLSGLLFDTQGVRLTPSHAVKGKRRYRYYIRRKQIGEVNPPRLSLPAQALDYVAEQMWLDFLQEQDLDLSLEAPDEKPDVGQRLRQAAAALGATWATFSVLERNQFFAQMAIRWIVVASTVTLEIISRQLRSYLLGDTFDENVQGLTRLITRQRGIDLTRSGGETRLVDSKTSEAQQVTDGHKTLLSSISRGRQWYEDLTHGKARNIAEIAQHENVSDAFVHHTLTCALTPAAQIARLLQGNADPDLSRALALRGFQS